jgi:hypothetical protein
MSKPFESHRRLLGCDAIVVVMMSQRDQNMVDHDATWASGVAQNPPPDNMGFPMMSTETLSIDQRSNRVYTSGLEVLGNT